MSTRAWWAMVALALFFGFNIGWAARTVDSQDRLTNAIARRYLAESEYYNTQSDRILAENKERQSGK